MSQTQKEQIRDLYMDGSEDMAVYAKDRWIGYPQSEHENAYDKIMDMINPDHYKVGGIETIDFMKAKSTKEEFCGHLRLTAIKYLSRAGHKDDVLQEYEKAKWYLEKLIEELSNGR